MRQATTSPVLSRFNIGRHLALCFALLIGMMVVCDGVLLWQLREMRSQVELLKAVDGELIEALRAHGELFSFYEKLSHVGAIRGPESAHYCIGSTQERAYSTRRSALRPPSVICLPRSR